MKENPEITVQFYFKRLYVLLYLYYKCKTLVIDGQDGNGLQLEKIGPTFSSLTPVCRQVIEHMSNYLYVSWFPPAVVRHFRDSICHRSYDCNVNDLFDINKRGQLITRCETLILVTGLAAKHCNHQSQMESYPSLHRGYENKTNSFFDLTIVKQNSFSKVIRSTWHKLSVISSLRQKLLLASLFQAFR